MLRGYVSVYERRNPVTSLLEDLNEVVQQVVQQVVIGRQVRNERAGGGDRGGMCRGQMQSGNKIYYMRSMHRAGRHSQAKFDTLLTCGMIIYTIRVSGHVTAPCKHPTRYGADDVRPASAEPVAERLLTWRHAGERSPLTRARTAGSW